jgi:hypothetical protein
MENFVNNMKKMGKTFFFMVLIALVIAVALLFVNPIYSIILVVSGIMGFILGVRLIKIIITDNPEKLIADMKELLDKYKIDNNLN